MKKEMKKSYAYTCQYGIRTVGPSLVYRFDSEADRDRFVDEYNRNCDDINPQCDGVDGKEARRIAGGDIICDARPLGDGAWEISWRDYVETMYL